MPYAKQNWQNGQVGSTPVSAARLNHIEDGVETATQLAEAGASPEQIETAVNSEIEAQAAAPESALNVAIEAGIEPKADKSGSKTDGQNVKNLRRPTLVIDKMFPNAFHDHQIVQVDEAGMKAWAIGQDRRVRTATWTSQNNAADAFGGVRSSSPDASAWAADGLFMRTSSGALLMDVKRNQFNPLIRFREEFKKEMLQSAPHGAARSRGIHQRRPAALYSGQRRSRLDSRSDPRHQQAVPWTVIRRGGPQHWLSLCRRVHQRRRYQHRDHPPLY